STCGFTRKSRASSDVSFCFASDTVRPATGTSPSSEREMLPVVCTVVVRVRSSLPKTITSRTSPAPSRYSGAGVGAGEAGAAGDGDPGQGEGRRGAGVGVGEGEGRGRPWAVAVAAASNKTEAEKGLRRGMGETP